MENKKATELAEKIAELIRAEAGADELSSIQNSIDQLSLRLDKIEFASQKNPQSTIRNPQSTHPSQDRFAIAEAIVDSLFKSSSDEKICTFESNAKPCDHCSMCSSRGF